MATQHLLQMGCRRIAYFATSRYSTIEDRLQGYMAAISQHNFQNPDDKAEDPVGLSDITGDIGELFEDFLIRNPQTDGIYVLNDRLAVILYPVLKRMKSLPGRDIRIVASDASEFCGSFSVPLSTVDFPTYQMGCSAASNRQTHSSLRRSLALVPLKGRALFTLGTGPAWSWLAFAQPVFPLSPAACSDHV